MPNQVRDGKWESLAFDVDEAEAMSKLGYGCEAFDHEAHQINRPDPHGYFAPGLLSHSHPT